MNIRKFYLENEKGTRYDLNGAAGVYYSSPTGLGQSNSHDFAAVNNGFFTRTKNEIKQGALVGDIIFTRDCYESFRAFSSFINTAEKLVFVYKPLSEEYRCDVVCNYITKTEIGRGKWLTVPVSFTTLSQWYKQTPVTVHFSDPTKSNYFRWGSGRWGQDILAANSNGEFSAEIDASGHIPAAVQVVFDGSIENPTFTLKGASGEIYGVCAMTGRYSGKLVLDTSYGASSITANGEDIIDAVDITKDPFFRVPTTEQCYVTITSPEFSGTASARVYEYFRSV